jgi:aminoglycoside phosphotransferase (APT) family kinase protein
MPSAAATAFISVGNVSMAAGRPRGFGKTGGRFFLILHCPARRCDVIDFGCMAVGDAACDGAIAWATLATDVREEFRAALAWDRETWPRGRGWALWKALIRRVGLVNGNACEQADGPRILTEIIADARRERRRL